MAELHLLVSCTAARLISTLMELLSPKYMLIDQHFAKCELVVETTWAVCISIQVRDRNIFGCFIVIAHPSPLLCINASNMSPCLTTRAIGNTIGKLIDIAWILFDL